MTRRVGDHFERVEPQTLADWRGWLSDNHTQAARVWVVYRKKAAGAVFGYGDIVDEALCFGWIDSLPRKLDDERSMILVSPRKPGSGWSAVNKAKIEKLVVEGRMPAPGLDKILAAKADGSWDQLSDVDALKEPADFGAALAATADAERYWRAFAPSVRRGNLERIQTARRPETCAKRIAETVRLGRFPTFWNRPETSENAPVLILDHVATLLAEPVWSQRGLGRFPTFWKRPETSENAPVLILDHVATLLAEPLWPQRGLGRFPTFWKRPETSENAQTLILDRVASLLAEPLWPQRGLASGNQPANQWRKA
jgi:uncharacterized protein YdeI (YjbR/CyaY-like superfamily)